MTTPRFDSFAFDEISRPDFADAMLIVLPHGATTDPRVWAETVFGGAGIPSWVKALLGVRQIAVKFIGIPPAPRDVFAVSRVEGDEAVIVAHDRHLDFVAAVGVDAERQLVRLTTTVRLKGWRGKVYFAPVRLLHPIVVQSMLAKAARSLAAGAPAAR